jgi:sulfonate transport system permease protein
VASADAEIPVAEPGEASAGAGGVPRAADAPVLVTLPTLAPGEQARSRWRIPRGIERLIGVLLFFALWEFASRVGWISPKVLAAPSTVLTAGSDLIRNGTLGTAVWVSLKRVLWGLGLGIPIGAALALIASLSRAGDDLVDANVQMLRFVPIIGLESLIILWLGIGETAKISLIVLGVAFPIYINTSSAIRSIDPRYHDLSDVVGLRWPARLRRVVLPGALPGFLVGVRMATAVAWLLLVFAEQINASSGLGYLIIRAQTFFQSDVIVVCLVMYALLGLASDGIVRFLERRLLRWQPGR